MNKIDREHINIIGRESTLDKNSIHEALKQNVYNQNASWQKFLRYMLLSLGIGFLVTGIVFFFAYNWADLNKFAKMGLIQLLIIASVAAVLFSKWSLTVKNAIMVGASVLVGVLFAVYGQIYQTGANAYDFFLGWTIFVTIWVLVSNFAPLWLLFIVLINTTLILYKEQVAGYWNTAFFINLLFVVNTIAVVIAACIPLIAKQYKAPNWFMYIVALAAAGIATYGIVIGIFDNGGSAHVILISLTLIAFALGVFYGFKTRNTFYLSVIPFSVIVIISSVLIKNTESEGMLLLLCLFIVASVSLTVKGLLDIQKKWGNGK